MPTTDDHTSRPPRQTPRQTGQKRISPERQARNARLEAQLRANLHRRKEAVRARMSEPADPAPCRQDD